MGEGAGGAGGVPNAACVAQKSGKNAAAGWNPLTRTSSQELISKSSGVLRAKFVNTAIIKN